MENKIVVITGGGSGIGLSLLRLFHESGMTVIACSRKIDQLQASVAVILLHHGGDVVSYKLDVRNETNIKEFANFIKTKFGHIDILINNAGIINVNKLFDISIAEWDDIINTNLRGSFLMCKYLANFLSITHGTIINISSVLGKRGSAGFSAYSASKFGLIGFTESIAIELKSSGINVFAVCPDSTLTDMHIKSVGHEKARSAMHPDIIAHAIFQIAIGKKDLKTGSSIIISKHLDQQLSTKRKIARVLLKPIESIIKKIYLFS